MNYDKIFRKRIDGTEIRYGVVFGNEKIVFIKTGVDGKIDGYDNKYLKMAQRLHERLGATVICSSNPFIEEGHVAADKAFIEKVVSETGLSSYTLFLFGTSDGAYHNLLLAKALPETVKLVCVNTSTPNYDRLKENLIKLSHVSKIFVYGDKDDEYHFLPCLEKENFENFELITVAGANHEFTGMVEEYILLSDLLK